MDAAPRKPGPGKWILIGCGCLVFLGLLIGGGCGAFAYFFAKAVREVGAVGERYLRSQPEVEAEFGVSPRIERKPMGFNINVTGDQGEAYFGYAVAGDKASGDAEVWFVKRGGQWQGVGAVLSVGEKRIPLGAPGSRPARKTD